PCHPEPIRFAQGKLREGPVELGAEMLRCAQHDSSVPHAASSACPPERSEGSVTLGSEVLRCAQHDSAVLLPRPRLDVKVSRSEL
ncbi:MAG TPA: hypothetical protein VFZ02_09985, partial [Ktedonobacteraceae bacterium]